METTSKDAAYNQTTFYEAWKLAIQRHGIFNPYTGRGVIKGLLPHGPHNVRDVLGTHILKQTGSYEQASYAIQDTPDSRSNPDPRYEAAKPKSLGNNDCFHEPCFVMSSLLSQAKMLKPAEQSLNRASPRLAKSLYPTRWWLSWLPPR